MSDRYYGLYRGVVESNDDPLGLMRISVTVSAVFDREQFWALPCVPPDSTVIPKAGSTVWIQFEQGDLDYPVWMGTLGQPQSGRRPK